MKIIKYTVYGVGAFFGGWALGGLIALGLMYYTLRDIDQRYNSDMFDW